MTLLSLRTLTTEDFDYVYALCETTMRTYVEYDLGDCFEKIARPTITDLLERSLFKQIESNGVTVGVIAVERNPEHVQLEEIYIEPLRQNEGIGTKVVKQVLADADRSKLPVRLRILRSNPAKVFYERLGFKVARFTKEVNYMERHCEAPKAVA